MNYIVIKYYIYNDFPSRLLGVCSKKRIYAGETSFPAFRMLRGQVLMSLTCSNALAGHSPSVAQDQRLQHPCCRFGKIDTAFELRHDKELAASCIIMKSMSVPPAIRFNN